MAESKSDIEIEILEEENEDERSKRLRRRRKRRGGEEERAQSPMRVKRRKFRGKLNPNETVSQLTARMYGNSDNGALLYRKVTLEEIIKRHEAAHPERPLPDIGDFLDFIIENTPDGVVMCLSKNKPMMRKTMYTVTRTVEYLKLEEQ